MYRWFAAALAALLSSFAAHAQVQRSFPANALRGSLVVAAAPEILLNDKPARLSAGARIRDQSNLQPRPASLSGAKLLVHYTLDTQGMVKDVWILTPDEAARKPWPTTPQQAQSWLFDPVAQTWSKP